VSRLDDFIQSHEIDPEELARLADVSSNYLARLRNGKSHPMRPVMMRIALACSWLTCEKVYVWELFDRI